ncbi:hypothetical protein AY601_2940 [Pedobacter cryoconitis]|uniref:Thioredoxin domain-containing protein n=1 Tax=Pedobacter cryoconitis TaxID=188932 RepID=A0A127VET1_9SPHI|nr:TlpA disulfide reductase family protein [Pedobacter cryoconitis]AMP99814.1 hypothetical protein AY601_2940 [Pedobacter cryoconitis]
MKVTNYKSRHNLLHFREIIKHLFFCLVIMLNGSLGIFAQENKAIDITTKGIQISQQVPDIIITNIHNYKTKTAKISDFKDKLLIIDFWATWCSPCVAMIPKMDSLQKAFGNKIQFLSATYQSEKEALPFLHKFEKQQKKHYDLPVVFGDKELHKLFPHTTLPHYVWVDQNGEVKAITEGKEVTEDNIRKMVSGSAEMTKKSDFKIAYDKNKPFLINGNGGDGTGLLYHSTLTRYIEGLELAGDFTLDSLNGRKISIRNANLAWLYQVAFSEKGAVFNEMNTVMEVDDVSKLTSSLSGKAYRDWLKAGNGFCYELIVPMSNMRESNKIMQQDLSRYFRQYSASIENRDENCLILKRTSSIDKIKSKGGKANIDLDRFGYHLNNITIGNLFYRLNFTQRTPLFLIDETGYNGKVDLTILASLPDISGVNKELEKYDLKIEEAKRKRNILVIKDNL